MASAFCYTHAVVCRIPDAFKSVATNDRSRRGFDIDEARRQHGEYVARLRSIGLDVLELPVDERLPKSPLVEDCAVVCNGAALIARPKAETRRKEVDTVRAVLKKELELPIIEITDHEAYLEGGDVLFTGQEFFVGLSSYTNMRGACALAAAFPEFPCSPVRVKEGHHLREFVSMAAPGVLCIGNGKDSQDLLKRLEREATFHYQKLTLTDGEAGNTVFANGTLLHRRREECPNACQVFEERLVHAKIRLAATELTRGGATLSSYCILVRLGRHITGLW